MTQIMVRREQSDQFFFCIPVYFFPGLLTKKKEEISSNVSLNGSCVLEKT